MFFTPKLPKIGLLGTLAALTLRRDLPAPRGCSPSQKDSFSPPISLPLVSPLPAFPQNDAFSPQIPFASPLPSQRVLFCPLKEALSGAGAALKRAAPNYFLLQGEPAPSDLKTPSLMFRKSPDFELFVPVFLAVLLRFRAAEGRDPVPQRYAEDAERLLRHRGAVLEELGAGAEALPDTFVRSAA